MGQDASTARARSDSTASATVASASAVPSAASYAYASASVSPEDLSKRSGGASSAKPKAGAAATAAEAPALPDLGERVLVVNSVDKKRTLEPELEKLQQIPEFQPILGTGTYSGISRALLGEVNPVPVAACFQRVQDHMQTCAKRASADQFKLAEEGKAASARVSTKLTVANKTSLKLEQVFKALKPGEDLVKEVQGALQAMAALHSKLSELNARLPEEDRLPSPPLPSTRPPAEADAEAASST